MITNDPLYTIGIKLSIFHLLTLLSFRNAKNENFRRYQIYIVINNKSRIPAPDKETAWTL